AVADTMTDPESVDGATSVTTTRAMVEERRIYYREQRGIGTTIAALRRIHALHTPALILLYRVCENPHNKEVFVKKQGLVTLAHILADVHHKVSLIFF